MQEVVLEIKRKVDFKMWKLWAALTVLVFLVAVGGTIGIVEWCVHNNHFTWVYTGTITQEEYVQLVKDYPQYVGTNSLQPDGTINFSTQRIDHRVNFPYGKPSQSDQYDITCGLGGYWLATIFAIALLSHYTIDVYQENKSTSQGTTMSKKPINYPAIAANFMALTIVVLMALINIAGITLGNRWEKDTGYSYSTNSLPSAINVITFSNAYNQIVFTTPSQWQEFQQAVAALPSTVIINHIKAYSHSAEQISNAQGKLLYNTQTGNKTEPVLSDYPIGIEFCIYVPHNVDFAYGQKGAAAGKGQGALFATVLTLIDLIVGMVIAVIVYGVLADRYKDKMIAFVRNNNLSQQNVQNSGGVVATCSHCGSFTTVGLCPWCGHNVTGDIQASDIKTNRMLKLYHGTRLPMNVIVEHGVPPLSNDDRKKLNQLMSDELQKRGLPELPPYHASLGTGVYTSHKFEVAEMFAKAAPDFISDQLWNALAAAGCGTRSADYALLAILDKIGQPKVIECQIDRQRVINDNGFGKLIDGIKPEDIVQIHVISYAKPKCDSSQAIETLLKEAHTKWEEATA